ncbi:MAG TPA: hypothetical protein VFD44_07000 [Hanamia sp.]|jgi:hypothetical protein|nr:hypothetical protein [Hanamia sp.]
METLNTTTALNIEQQNKAVFNLLRITYTVIPIAAGLDKFLNLLTNWEKYLDTALVSSLPFSAHSFMMVVGAIEIIAGIIVFLKPRIGGFIVAAWLVLIALTLLAGGKYIDVAVRDIVMAVGALSLAIISKIKNLEP